LQIHYPRFESGCRLSLRVATTRAAAAIRTSFLERRDASPPRIGRPLGGAASETPSVSQQVRVRFAPSPTGYLHIGGARTALFNYLFARKSGGAYVLRLEDTDAERNTEASKRTIYEGLRWLGLSPDEGPEQGGPHGPYAQSERDALYREFSGKLLEKGGVYPCFCSKETLDEMRKRQVENKLPQRYDGRCRKLDRAEVDARVSKGDPYTLRLKVPEGETVLEDLIRGEIRVKNEDVEDIILVRTGGAVVYNLAVVFDDHEMGVTHVIRGEDHLTNTFKQIVIYRAMGWDVPRFAHLPLILAPAGEGKLSKRKHPEAALEHYQRKGYPVEALINWLALIGWSFDDKTEIMTREELIERFSIERVVRTGARLNLEKLDWMAGEYIRRMPLDDVVAAATHYLVDAGLVKASRDAATDEKIRRVVAAEHGRLRYWSQIVEIAAWAFRDALDFEKKATENLKKRPDAAALLRAYAAALPAAPWTDPAALEAVARAFATEKGIGFGDLVHPVRAALTGRTTGTGLFDCHMILGRDKSVERLLSAAASIGG
jgi:glutamyl-tRNA synthetase